MASTIKVNNIQNQCGANIVNKCSTTITLGASGDTIQLACGASQTGFGRTGTVNWDTTAKTAGFTAVSGNGYFVNTTSGAVTMTLPATPSAGDIVAVADYANTFATNNLTVARNGSLINGSAFDYESSTNGISLTFVYVDGTRGWKNVNDGTTDATGQSNFIIATGGTVTCCGDYKIHTFTGPGTFTVTNAGNPCGSDTVDYLVVAGGGGGGGPDRGGGGGAGGHRESSGAASGCYSVSPLGACVAALPVTAQGYPITVGGGGSNNANGSNSVFSTITSTGGGKGGSNCASVSGAPGGSGGGGASPSIGSGNTPPVSPPQGNNGGTGQTLSPSSASSGGGGGGASATGTPAPTNAVGGAGGNGVSNSITTSSVTRAGGGGGHSYNSPDPSPAPGGAGGSGGGGAGGPWDGVNSSTPAKAGTPGTVNTGGGGGGAGSYNGGGGTGGSGIVIIRYKYQ